MRKALVGLILAASVLTPAAASAQQEDEQGRPMGRRAQNQVYDGREPVVRAERRAERQVDRAERRAERQQSFDPGPAQAQANAQAQFEARAAQRQARIEAQQQAQGNFEARAARRQARIDAGQQAQGNFEARAARQAQIEAQQQGQAGFEGRRQGRDGRWQGRPGSIYPDAWQGNPNDPNLRRYQRREVENQRRYGTADQRAQVRDWRRDNRFDGRNGRWDGRRDWRRDWNRGWRGDRRYDWASWRYRNRNVFRLGSYYSPYRNHRYSRFNIGFYLDPGFYGRNYWIHDPWYYRLPPAPPGTQWIRYYDDVLLVDIYSGYVIDVIYDFFW